MTTLLVVGGVCTVAAVLLVAGAYRLVRAVARWWDDFVHGLDVHCHGCVDDCPDCPLSERAGNAQA